MVKCTVNGTESDVSVAVLGTVCRIKILSHYVTHNVYMYLAIKRFLKQLEELCDAWLS